MYEWKEDEGVTGGRQEIRKGKQITRENGEIGKGREGLPENTRNTPPSNPPLYLPPLPFPPLLKGESIKILSSKQ